MVTVVDARPPVLTVNVALVAPAATVTLDGAGYVRVAAGECDSRAA